MSGDLPADPRTEGVGAAPFDGRVIIGGMDLGGWAAGSRQAVRDAAHRQAATTAQRAGKRWGGTICGAPEFGERRVATGGYW